MDAGSLLSVLSSANALLEHMQARSKRADHVSSLIPGTEYEEKDVKTIVINTSRDPALASLFNHASMAHNNEFFFRTLSPAPPASGESRPTTESGIGATATPVPSALHAALDQSFSSLETLRREFVATAMAMFGPGFVWLVRLNNLPGRPDAFRLLTTYLAGSPYPGAHARRQGVDMNTVGGAGASPAARQPAESYLAQQARALGRGATMGEKAVAPGGVDLVPVLCLNTWEHVWLTDYGVGAGGKGGKRAFVEKWWDRINWNEVSALANLTRRPFFQSQRTAL